MGKVHTRCSERKNKRRRTTQRKEKRKGEEDRLQPHISRHATCLVRKREVDWSVWCVCGVLVYRKAKATLWCENDLCTRLKSTHDRDFVFVTSFPQYLVLFKGLSPTDIPHPPSKEKYWFKQKSSLGTAEWGDGCHKSVGFFFLSAWHYVGVPYFCTL